MHTGQSVRRKIKETHGRRQGEEEESLVMRRRKTRETGRAETKTRQEGRTDGRRTRETEKQCFRRNGRRVQIRFLAVCLKGCSDVTATQFLKISYSRTDLVHQGLCLRSHTTLT